MDPLDRLLRQCYINQLCNQYYTKFGNSGPESTIYQDNDVTVRYRKGQFYVANLVYFPLQR